MSLESCLSQEDCARVTGTFRRMAAHDIYRWAVTGGIAIELHILGRGGESILRPLHDIDFMASSFDCIPKTMGSGLLLRHVHPSDPPAKTMLQAVDPETAVRIDVFRAYGLEMNRTLPIEIAKLPIRMVSLQDMVARHGCETCSPQLGLDGGQTSRPEIREGLPSNAGSCHN